MFDPAVLLRVEALGPLRVHRGPVQVDLGPTKQRAVFAALVIHAGQTVSIDSLLNIVWGENRPISARQLVHTYVARLRRVLEPEMPPHGRIHLISSVPGGYRLTLGNEFVDVTRFNLLYQQAKRYLAANELVRTFDLLGEAIRMWRDPALTELCALLHATDTIDFLRQAWYDAALEYVGVGLNLGEAPRVLPVAQQLAATDPMHEVGQARYLAALQQTGQRAAAIEHFNDIRVMLSDELGVAPGPQLSGAYRSVLLATQPRSVDRPANGSVPAPARPPWRGPGPGLGQLVNREEDLAALTGILAEQRLVTVAGPPGCGKSVLALQVAARVRDDFLGGVAVLECSEIADADQLSRALVNLLDGVPDVDTPSRLLGDRQMLVVLDNVEHLVDPCAAVVDDVVRACRQVSVVVTSREPLSLPYETTRRLDTLTVSAAGEPRWVGDRPAVQLFARRAAQVCPSFHLTGDNAPAVAALCERLDDLPLAVELAAACLATDSLDELVGRLDDPLHQFQPLRRGSPSHQRSLPAALRRSLDCLTEYERWCFLRLGGLPRCFEAAAAGTAWEPAPWGLVDARAMLTRLVDKSLLFVRHDPVSPRYCMLRLVHRFAAELGAIEFA